MQQRLTFPGQQPDEKIHLVLRRHWVILLGQLLVPIAMLLIYLILYFVIKINYPSYLEGFGRSLAIIITSMYILFVWLVTLVIWVDYYLDVWIVTDKRIVDIQQLGLFHREVAEFNLLHTQDVAAYQKGLLATFFNYGDVNVQTAGAVLKFVFYQIPKPYRTEKQILDIYEKLVEKVGAQEALRLNQGVDLLAKKGRALPRTREEVKSSETSPQEKPGQKSLSP